MQTSGSKLRILHLSRRNEVRDEFVGNRKTRWYEQSLWVLLLQHLSYFSTSEPSSIFDLLRVHLYVLAVCNCLAGQHELARAGSTDGPRLRCHEAHRVNSHPSLFEGFAFEGFFHRLANIYKTRQAGVHPSRVLVASSQQATLMIRGDNQTNRHRIRARINLCSSRFHLAFGTTFHRDRGFPCSTLELSRLVPVCHGQSNAGDRHVCVRGLGHEKFPAGA
mmetsp:Transcript_49215/g.78426  ORF Transcript_49215/g.78426 Transcript_49215/m.78426 type:complete len:220 (-) Transcript_49215:69-728(-)